MQEEVDESGRTKVVERFDSCVTFNLHTKQFEMKRKCSSNRLLLFFNAVYMETIRRFGRWIVPFCNVAIITTLSLALPYKTSIVHESFNVCTLHGISFFFFCLYSFHLPTEATLLLLICFTLSRLMARLYCGWFYWQCYQLATVINIKLECTLALVFFPPPLFVSTTLHFG